MSTAEWTSLVFVLADILSQTPCSIEIIPGSSDEWKSNECPQQYQTASKTFPFLVTEGNVGVPQKDLYKLYLAAVALFKSARNLTTQAGTIDALAANPLIASSNVILLANSAHQTALNMRKRLVQRGFLSPQEELGFIDALLRGSGECVKQSIIWAHRRWLFQCLYGQAYVSTYAQTHSRAVDEWTQYGDSACFPDMPPDAIRSEFRIVSLACEKYPRNYHAWTHWRFCMDTLYFSIQNSAESDSKSHRDYIDVLADTIFSLRCWVEQHVSDHSAVHQLCSLARDFGGLPLQHSYPLSNDSVSGNPPCSVDAASSWAHAMSLLALYPTHESLWMYLRGALFFAPNNSRKKMLEQLRSLPICESQLAYRCLVWSARLDGRLQLDHDDSATVRSIIAGDPKHPLVQEIAQGME